MLGVLNHEINEIPDVITKSPKIQSVLGHYIK